MSMIKSNTLDDRHEIFNRFKSLCAECRHYDGHYGCAAFLCGIPEDFLTGDKQHTEVVKDQHGTDVFEAI